ncbi:MAG: hypothetical protein F4Y98_05665 [Chloroflexi bacterium]|nr:hypothetical protein [Chloroflexota bacterium]
MVSEQLVVIELPEGGKPRIILDREELPLLRGDGDTDYRCGACDIVLAEQVWQWEVRNVVFRCRTCGADNEVRK